MNEEHTSSRNNRGLDAPGAGETVSFRLPARAMAPLTRIATYRGMTCEALVREYLGAGLREDVRGHFEEQVLVATEDALASRVTPEVAADVLAAVRAEFKPGAAARPRPRTRPAAD